MLTYRSNARDTLRAAYVGTVRVGYVEQRTSFTQPGWRWQLILLRPEGGAYWGVEDDEADAKTELEKAFAHWMASAGLQHSAATIKETTHGHERTDSAAAADAGRGADQGKRRGKAEAVAADGAESSRKPARRPASRGRRA